MIGSRLDYCNFIIYKTTQANITKLQRVHNSLARVVLQMPRSAHVDDLLVQLHWLPVSYRIYYKIALITYKALKFGQTRYLADLFIHQHQVRATRSECQYQLYVYMCSSPVPNSQTAKQSNLISRFSLCRSINLELIAAWSANYGNCLAFKTGLKTYMFLSAIYMFMSAYGR